MDIKIGASHTAKTVVDNSNTASALGSGLVDVFATPMMVALLEHAASACIKPFLDEGMASVGTLVNVSHDAATPIGMEVQATATVTAVEGRKVEFSVSVTDAAGPVGSGTHSRFVIDKARFMEKVERKRQG